METFVIFSVAESGQDNPLDRDRLKLVGSDLFTDYPRQMDGNGLQLAESSRSTYEGGSRNKAGC
jgi:hypothetical protein